MHAMERNARSTLRSAPESGRRLMALALPALLLSGLVTLTIVHRLARSRSAPSSLRSRSATRR